MSFERQGGFGLDGKLLADGPRISLTLTSPPLGLAPTGGHPSDAVNFLSLAYHGSFTVAVRRPLAIPELVQVPRRAHRQPPRAPLYGDRSFRPEPRRHRPLVPVALSALAPFRLRHRRRCHSSALFLSTWASSVAARSSKFVVHGARDRTVGETGP